MAIIKVNALRDLTTGVTEWLHMATGPSWELGLWRLLWRWSRPAKSHSSRDGEARMACEIPASCLCARAACPFHQEKKTEDLMVSSSREFFFLIYINVCIYIHRETKGEREEETD